MTTDNFLDYYDLYRTTKDIEPFNKALTYKTCKFCKKSYPNASFLTIPHIIPELFGRNKLTSNFECDNCNQMFQKYETDTATFVQHYISLIKGKTKNGIPTFQSRKDNEKYPTILKSVSNETTLIFGTNHQDFKYEDNKLIVNFRLKKFRPFHIYKTFLKIGISLLTEEDLKINNHYYDFLNSDTPIDNGMQIWSAFRYMLKTKYFEIPSAEIYKARNTIDHNIALPEYTLLIKFANIIFQFFLPISNKNITEHKKDNTLNLHLFPSFYLDDITRLTNIEMFSMDLKETNKVSITDQITFYYGEKFSVEDTSPLRGNL